MKFIQGEDREQTTIFCLDQAVSQDNEVRLIDLFVHAIKLSEYGFKTDFIDNGRPAYHPTDLLKLFIYGYMNRIRSSRQLEKECKRNLELMWLMRGLAPDHNTIANFRKDNPKAIRKVFHATVSLAKNFDLIGQNELKKFLKELILQFLVLSSYFKDFMRLLKHQITNITFFNTLHLLFVNRLYLSKKQFNFKSIKSF